MNRRTALRNTGLLTGGTALAPALLSLLQSCQSENRLDWQPQFFTEDEALFVTAFADTLIPQTDTPGALDVKVDLFLDKVFAMAYDAESQEQVREDIAAFNAKAAEAYGAPFADLSDEDRAAVFRAAEADSGKFRGQVWGTAVGEQEPIGFYRSLKMMVIGAYLSSEKIGTEVLRYDPIPGGYDGCMPLESGDRKWSL
ncbi:gluconate 2-dehydrogenase subunit 3 family protein [Flavilitoribacter nigricans]|uniref:Multidrug ABC transporter permease n=1 Tax=Flavilitoribacter nigricans (strain ATCC 23147 / DSM 23189 / NBRC 102662 / NCIMB 1420 / SS-2) TaxID=1122177 RepID=A0A2D0NI43_FLAN2|nr:gluconate 2-dehydrogenase subunit 3 family protein [Flavilitoribacter nigricans]PHN08151.1 multidrug ABC transporter permease [Flavilitoribacter nigricans DSM 23189 = NBRC 102662]